jgi:hypothetical protein
MSSRLTSDPPITRVGSDINSAVGSINNDISWIYGGYLVMDSGVRLDSHGNIIILQWFQINCIKV